MCSGSKSELCPSKTLMEGEFKKQEDESVRSCSVLLELSACDEILAFRTEIEENKLDVDESSFWYCRGIGSKTMGCEERTPLMVAAMYGSTEVLKYIISTGKADVNRVCGADQVTALHCAVAGCANSSVEVIKLLVDASADPTCVDANGNKPADLVTRFSRFMPNSKRKAIELQLKGVSSVSLVEEEEEEKVTATQLSKYPIDVSLPDINNGIYGTDEFRMYAFKVKPCSRAYSHDWTECPFVHPGENARRRDPRKYPYTCVPCPEFRKGSCLKGDACEYAHGVFESWLHPAQYRTRLCKDEIGCNRKVCFFAHKPEELRPVNASTGSAMPSPRSACGQTSVSGMETPVLSPLALGSSASAFSTSTSTPPMSPLVANISSSPRNGGLWQNKVNNNLNLSLSPPLLQLQGSRLKTALSARDLDMEMELLGLENNRKNQMGFSRLGDLKPTELNDAFNSFDSTILSPLQDLSETRYQSPTSLQRGHNRNHHLSPPVRKQSSFGFDTSVAVAAAVMNSRSSAFAKRSQSFIDRRAVNPTVDAAMASLNVSRGWGSPGGKLDWGVHGDELNKLRRSVSFANRGNDATAREYADEPDVSWVSSLVKDGASEGTFEHKQRFASWVEQKCT